MSGGGLRARLTLYYASLFALLMVVGAIVGHIAVARMAEIGTHAVLRAVASGSSDPSAIAAAAPIPVDAARLIRDGDGWRAAFADGSRDRLSAGLVRRAATSEPVVVALPRGPSIAHVRLTGPSHALLVAHPVGSAMAPFEALRRTLLVVGAIGLAVMLMGTWTIAGRITRPIVALDHAVRRLRDGEAAEVRIAGDGELTRLAEGFNAMARVAHLAFHDALTGLPNRTLFRERLDALVALDQPFALLCVDLDGFKAVNDTLGHSAGDEVLRIVARRLESVAGDALVARLGGDEFSLILATTDRAAADALAVKLVEAVAGPAIVAGARVAIGASVGIAHHPADAATAADLVRRADSALYAAKAAGRGTARRYAG